MGSGADDENESQAGRTPALHPPPSDDNLLTYLTLALERFRQGGERRDGGRGGMSMALGKAIQVLSSRLPPDQQHLVEPLQALKFALYDLFDGAVHPALLPRRNGRPRARVDVLRFKATCIAASDVLHRHRAPDGQWSRREADLAIFERTKASATRLGIPMTKKSIETWRRDARKNLTREGKPTTDFGVFLYALRKYALDDSRWNAQPLETQLDDLLVPYSDANLSHLPVTTQGC